MQHSLKVKKKKKMKKPINWAYKISFEADAGDAEIPGKAVCLMKQLSAGMQFKVWPSNRVSSSNTL